MPVRDADEPGGWRAAAGEAHHQLETLGTCFVGQHVHLARLLALNARCAELEPVLAADARLRKLAGQLCAADPSGRVLHTVGRDLPLLATACIERLDRRRSELLAERQSAAACAASAQSTGRLVPEWPEAARAELERIECQLLLLYAAYVRRLWQRAESLPYVNDRPYTLALYLLFGREIFPPICRNVEFDVEYVSPCPMSQLGRQVECHAFSEE